MPGNRFKVSELWDGIKKTTSDAWNEGTGRVGQLLSEIWKLATKYLPEINLILRIVTSLPGLLRSILDLVKSYPRTIERLRQFLSATIGKIPTAVNKLIDRATKATLAGFRQGLKNVENSLKRGFNAAIKPLPKSIQDRIRTTLKPAIDGVRNIAKDGLKQINRLSGDIGKLRSFATAQLGKTQAAIVKSIQSTVKSAVTGLDKRVLGVKEALFREYAKGSAAVSKTVQTATGNTN